MGVVAPSTEAKRARDAAKLREQQRQMMAAELDVERFVAASNGAQAGARGGAGAQRGYGRGGSAYGGGYGGVGGGLGYGAGSTYGGFGGSTMLGGDEW